MKKTLSLLLAVVMVLSTFSCLTVITSAKGDIDQLFFEPVEEIKIPIGAHCEYVECENPDCDCDGYYKRYNYRSCLFKDGATLELDYDDGTCVPYYYSEDAAAFISDEEEFIYDEEINFIDDQAENHWLYEGDYTCIMEYNGLTCEINLELVDQPLGSISFIPAKPIVLVEGTDGYMNEEGWFEFEFDPEGEGNIFKITDSDGASTEYIYDEEECGFIDEFGLYFDFVYDCYVYSDQSADNVWGSGEHYFTIEYNEYKTTVPVTIVANPIASISFAPVKPIELIEKYDGDFDYEYDYDTDDFVEWFRYGYDFCIGDTLTLNYTDGISKDFVYSETEYGDCEFVCANDDEELDEWDIEINDTQSYENQWKIGGAYEIVITYNGRSTTVPVKIVETPIKNIKPTLKIPFEYYENVAGEMTNVDGKKVFQYYFDEDEAYFNFEKLEVTYKDGSIKTFYENDDDWGYFKSEDGENFFCDFSADTTKWKLGSNNTLQLSAYGKTINIPVSVLKNPVKSISYAPAGPVRLRENVDGYLNSDFDDYTEEGYEYFVYAYDCKTGDVITVNYTDGTTKEYTCRVEHIYAYDDYYVTTFVDENGEELKNFNQRGYANISSNQGYDKQWKLGGKYSFTFTYMNKQASIPVEIVGNPVKAIDFTPVKPIELMQGVDVWDEDALGDIVIYVYDIDIFGNKITLTYSDGSKKTFTCKLDNGDFVYISDDGEVLDNKYFTLEDDQFVKQWDKPGDYSFELSYMGVSTKVPVKVVENNISSVSIDVAKPYVFAYEKGRTEYNISYNGEILQREGNKIIVNYKDGSKTEYVWNQESYDTFRDGWCDSEGNRFNHCFFSWQDDAWTLDRQNNIVFKILGEEVILPVTLSECDHQWTAEGCQFSKPTCTQYGYMNEVCSKCGALGEGKSLSRLGHDYSTEWVIDKEATCTEEGIKSHHCSRCSSRTDVVIVLANGHEFTDWIIDKPATYTEDGLKHRDCTVCGETVETVKIPQLNLSAPKLKSVANATNGVKVSWDAVEGASAYIVYRKTSKSGWTNLGTTAETTFTDTTAKSGTTYYYTVKSQDGSVTSSYNKTGLAIKYLAAPKLSKVYNNGKGNVLSWGKVTGASGYYVYRKTPSSGWSKIATIKKGTTASYTDKKVTYGKTYIYTVKAYSGKTTSSFNADGITILKKIPNVTIATKNVTGGKKVVLSSSIKGATIYYKTSAKGSYKKYTGEFGLTSTKTIYAYAVKSGYYKSSTASKKIAVTKAKAPSISVSNCVGGKKITLKTSTPNATLYYKTSKNGKYVKYTAPFTLSSTKTIYAKTYAKGYVTSSAVSKKVSVSKIGTPTGVSAKAYADANKIVVKWKAVSGAQGYYVYRADDTNKSYTRIATVKGGKTVSFTDVNYMPGVKNYYIVRAYCSGKATSSNSKAVSVTAPANNILADPYAFYQKAAQNIHNNGVAGFSRESWQNIISFEYSNSANENKMKDIVDGYFTPEEYAITYTVGKGSADCKRWMPATTTTKECIKSANATKVGANYKIEIVLKDQYNPMMNDVDGIVAIAPYTFYIEDVEDALQNDESLKDIVKPCDKAEALIKNYTITAVMTPDGKFVSISHRSDIEFFAQGKEVDETDVSCNAKFVFAYNCTDFKY